MSKNTNIAVNECFLTFKPENSEFSICMLFFSSSSFFFFTLFYFSDYLIYLNLGLVFKFSIDDYDNT